MPPMPPSFPVHFGPAGAQAGLFIGRPGGFMKGVQRE
jgi:hypothetical protein